MNYKLVVTGVVGLFLLLELLAGRFWFRKETRPRDVAIELISGVGLPVLIVPVVLWASAGLCEWVLPDSAGRLSHWPGWLMFGVLLVADDLSQYGWHRLSHSWPWLYRLHRAHHSAGYLSVRVVYRNNLLYYAMMPGLWLSGALLHMGFAPAYYVYFIAKMAVIIAAHSSVAWDDYLDRTPALRPVVWVLARIISTPRTHAAHHGKHAADVGTHYAGNYGNFLFLWDVLFGTAVFNPRRPLQYGLENVPEVPWWREVFWPFGGRGS